jgi:hypothetical protein
MMAAPSDQIDEPAWVRRLKNDGFEIRGGEGILPEEPRASFPPIRQGPVQRLRNVIERWLRPHPLLVEERRHASVP